MRISKKAVLDQITYHVSYFERYFDSSSSATYQVQKWESAVSSIRTISSLFDNHADIVKACQDAVDRCNTIFTYLESVSVDTVSLVASECLGSNGIGEDLEATVQTSISDPLEQVDWTEVLPDLPVSRCSGNDYDKLTLRRFAALHLDSIDRFCRSKFRPRGVRFSQAVKPRVSAQSLGAVSVGFVPDCPLCASEHWRTDEVPSFCPVCNETGLTEPECLYEAA